MKNCPKPANENQNQLLADTDVYNAFIRISGSQKVFAEAIGTNDSSFSRWLSRPVPGHDNNRTGPLEFIDRMSRYARAELDIARDHGDENKIEKCEAALQILGKYGAQRGKGIYTMRTRAAIIIKALENAIELLKEEFGMLTIF